MKLTYPAIFYPSEDKTTCIAKFPDLPGCMTFGKNLDEAYLMAIDAASGWLLTTLEYSEPLPPSTPIDKIILDKHATAKILIIDLDKYLINHPTKITEKKSQESVNLIPQVIIT